MERADKIRRQVGRCMEELLQGTLTEAGLREILDTLDEGPPRQQLLFLRVDGSTISAGVIGMMMPGRRSGHRRATGPTGVALRERHRRHSRRLAGDQVSGACPLDR